MEVEKIVKLAVAVTFILFIWFAGLFLFRFESFRADGKRRKKLLGENNEIRADQLKTHSEALYRDVDLFLKVSLAIFGGIAFIAISRSAEIPIEIATRLISMGFNLQLYTAIFSVLFILIHKRSVILRWKYRFMWWEIFLWGETWGIFFGMLFSCYAFLIAQPEILALLNRKQP